MSGTNGNVINFINAVERASPWLTISSTSTSWVFNNPSLALQPGDVINVRTIWTLSGGGQATCDVPSSRSNFITVQETTTAPTIVVPKCGLLTTLSGSSSEPAGTVLQFYTGGTAGKRNGTLIPQSGTTTPITATVTSTGSWSAVLSAAAGGGIAAGTVITARAKAPGEVKGVNSNAVQSVAGPAGVLTLNSPILEGATSVSSTGPTGAVGAKVTLYIEGTPFATPVAVAPDGK